MKKDIDSAELSEYIRTFIKGIQEGIKPSGLRLKGDIEFELAVVNLSEKEGGLKIYVTNAMAKTGSERLTKVKFKVGQGSSFSAMAR